MRTQCPQCRGWLDLPDSDTVQIPHWPPGRDPRHTGTWGGPLQYRPADLCFGGDPNPLETDLPAPMIELRIQPDPAFVRRFGKRLKAERSGGYGDARGAAVFRHVETRNFDLAREIAEAFGCSRVAFRVPISARYGRQAVNWSKDGPHRYRKARPSDSEAPPWIDPVAAWQEAQADRAWFTKAVCEAAVGQTMSTKAYMRELADMINRTTAQLQGLQQSYQTVLHTLVAEPVTPPAEPTTEPTTTEV